jgi:peptide/nickel transport system permease protein
MTKQKTRLWLAGIFLALLHVCVFLAGFFAPYSPAAQNRDLPYAPPMRIHFFGASGRMHLRPFVYALVPDLAKFNEYIVDSKHPSPLRFFVRGDKYTVAGLFHSNLHLFGVDAPARILLLGSDAFGRDQFSRLVFGGQVSLAAGLAAAIMSLGLGLLLGAISGFYGRWLDEGMMRITELFMALPWIYLLLAIRAFLPLHVSPVQAFFLLVCVIGAVGWTRPARLIRGTVLSAKERGYVLAGRGFGASDWYLLRRHILPQTTGILLTQAAILVPQYILAEATLSFLGLGLGEPVPSWGNMLAALQQYKVIVSCWWMFAPAVTLVIVSGAYFVLSDSLHRLESASNHQ